MHRGTSMEVLVNDNNVLVVSTDWKAHIMSFNK